MDGTLYDRKDGTGKGMNQVTFEVCCGSVEDCVCAQEGGADRIELNSALFLGGLTPTTAVLKLAKEKVSIPIVCMVRPRGAGFCYNELEVETMFLEAQQLLEQGASGLAFGFLNEDATIDEKNTKRMVELIHSYSREAVFHRAFDCVKDPFTSIETLISLSVDRILTSGLEPTAPAGSALLKQLQENYGAKIEILAGCGIRSNNVLELIQETKVKQVHSSARVWRKDVTTSGEKVSYRFSDVGDYDGVGLAEVKEIANRLGR